MLTMHYNFTFPADYDMAIIQRRISDNAHKLNGFPELIFKAYLYAFKNPTLNQANQYAPLYLWQSHEGIGNFLSSTGYQRLETDLGRPSIQFAVPLATALSERLGKASFCKKEVIRIPRTKTIEELIQQEEQRSEEVIANPKSHIVAVVSTLNSDQWTMTRWTLLSKAVQTKEDEEHGTQWFHVGYLSQ